MAHVHHDKEPPAPLHGALRLVVLGLVLGTAVGLLVLWPTGEGPRLREDDSSIEYVDATVTEVTDGTCAGVEPTSPTTCQNVVADVTSGATAGTDARFSLLDTDFSVPDLEVGDDVVLLRNETAPPDLQYSYADLQRDRPLVGLFILFAVAVVAFGRLVGLRALAGLAASLGVVLVFILPALIRDGPPLPIAFVGTTAIALVSLYVTHGISMRTTVALLGTMGSVIVVGVLASIFVGLTRFTGLVDESAQILVVTAEAVDLRGLLVAGIVIGALGVLDDVTVTQVAAVEELRLPTRAGPRAGCTPRRCASVATMWPRRSTPSCSPTSAPRCR